MNKKVWTAIALALPVLAFSLRVTSTTETNSADTKKIQWTTFDKGIELAQKEDKLLVVDFYTDWCHWCKVMDEKTYGNQQVIDYAKDKVILAKLNAETNEKFKFKDAFYTGRELSMIFGVTGFPTTIFMGGDGEFITKVPGFIPAEKFRTVLEFFADDWHEKMSFDEFEKKKDGKADKN